MELRSGQAVPRLAGWPFHKPAHQGGQKIDYNEHEQTAKGERQDNVAMKESGLQARGQLHDERLVDEVKGIADQTERNGRTLRQRERVSAPCVDVTPKGKTHGGQRDG